MLKALEGPASRYAPSRASGRSDAWLKLKKDYVAGLGDSFDVVPVGAWHGSGRKAGWFSPVLLAVWSPQNQQLQSLCRCMSGFSDEVGS
jgi:DNA ligase-1